jgi:hypothetical protein
MNLVTIGNRIVTAVLPALTHGETPRTLAQNQMDRYLQPIQLNEG